MAKDVSRLDRPERGFSLVEVLIVVLIVAIMGAVALPNIGQYIKNYRIKGAAQMVAGELAAARSRAVMSNTNLGVSFVVVDRDSYRFVQEDIDPARPERLGGLKRLPVGVVFLESALDPKGSSLRFLRLGGFCNPGVGGCRAAVPSAERYTAAESGVLDAGTLEGLSPIGTLANGGMEIRLRENSTGLERTVQVAPGGRVLPQP